MHRAPVWLSLSLPLLTSLLAPMGHAQPGVVSTVVVAPAAGTQAATARSASEAALRDVQITSPSAHALWRLGQAGPSLVTGLREATAGTSPVERARAFLQAHAALVGVPLGALRDTSVRASADRTAVGFQQTAAGRDVWGRTLTVTIDGSGNVVALSSEVGPIDTVAAATLRVEDAKVKALTAAGAAGGSAGKSVIVAGPAGAYEAAVFYVARPGSLEALEVVVNLHDGSVTSMKNTTHTAARE